MRLAVCDLRIPRAVGNGRGLTNILWLGCFFLHYQSLNLCLLGLEMMSEYRVVVVIDTYIVVVVVVVAGAVALSLHLAMS